MNGMSFVGQHLRRCGVWRPSSTAVGRSLLDRWARDGAIRAKDATIAGIRPQKRAAARTLVEEQASFRRHCERFPITTGRAPEHRLKFDDGHAQNYQCDTKRAAYRSDSACPTLLKSEQSERVGDHDERAPFMRDDRWTDAGDTAHRRHHQHDDHAQRHPQVLPNDAACLS
jgi:hypothetical protein